MAVKDWIPVAQDIYDALIADGNLIQGKTLKISHKDLCKILSKHSVLETETMNDPINESEETPFLVGVIESTVKYKDLSKSLYDNGLFKGDLTDAEEGSAYASHNCTKSLWVYQIAHKLQSAFKDPISFYEDEYEEDQEVDENRVKEDAKKDVEALVKSTKHDKYIKICSEIVEIRRKLGAISILDLSTIVGNEFFSNGASLFAVPGDKRYIKVLEILNNISSIVYSLSTEISLEEMLGKIEEQFDKLDEIAESFKNSDSEENNKLNLVLEYLDSIKASGNKIGISELLKAFVVGEIIASESERVFLAGGAVVHMTQLTTLLNAANFDIKDKTQVDTCKMLLSAIKQDVLTNKTVNNFGGFTAGKPFPPPPLPGIDPKIYQKAAAFDKIVEALGPVFIELEKQKPLMQGFGSPLNGWGSPFNMNSMFKV